MDYLGNSILQLTGSDPAILAAILALEAVWVSGVHRRRGRNSAEWLTARDTDHFFYGAAN